MEWKKESGPVKIKLIIFDLDGTLVDSSIDITNALNYAIAPYDIEKIQGQKTIRLIGEGLTRLIEKLLGEDKAGIKPDVLKRFLYYYGEHLADFTRPYQGVTETLEKLENYKKAVISNKREAFSKKLLAELHLSEYFDVILGSDSVAEKKPSPAPVYKVLEIMSLTPEEAVIVGDSNFDIEAGNAAGLKTIGVSYGYRDASTLKDADFIIDDIKALVLKLKELALSNT